jgi:hypothetical protein
MHHNSDVVTGKPFFSGSRVRPGWRGSFRESLDSFFRKCPSGGAVVFSDSEIVAEAARLASLTARQRKEALAVHWRIAEDATLSVKTREYARRVAEALINEQARLKRRKL